MCRWLAYSGEAIALDELILKTDISLIDQSLSARRGEVPTNGDGFGIGWYGKGEFPGVYRETRPAWNDENLRHISGHIESRLFLAHVRAATGTAVQRSNCHPFQHGRWLFLHNGLVRDFDTVKRELVMAVEPELFPAIRGTTDSEILFFLALGLGLDRGPLPALERMVGLVEAIGRRHGILQPVQMTLGLSDGRRLYAVRYSSEGSSRTLFHSKSMHALRELYPDNPRLAPFPHDARAIVSEPLTELTDLWVEIPEATALVVEAGEIECHDFTPWNPE